MTKKSRYKIYLIIFIFTFFLSLLYKNYSVKKQNLEPQAQNLDLFGQARGIDMIEFFNEPLSEERMNLFYNNRPNFDQYIDFMRSGLVETKHGEVIKLVCYGTENYPDKVGNIFSTYAGGGADLAVPTCEKYDLAYLNSKLTSYYSLMLEMIKHINVEGTAQFSVYKEFEISRIRLATDQTFIKLQEKEENNLINDELKKWSKKNKKNKKQYTNLELAEKKAFPALTKYYINKFHVDEITAAKYTTNTFNYLKTSLLSGLINPDKAFGTIDD